MYGWRYTASEAVCRYRSKAPAEIEVDGEGWAERLDAEHDEIDPARESALVEVGALREERVEGSDPVVDYDVEAVFQSGRVSGSAIRAWAIGLICRYAFATNGKPRAGRELDAGSGDHDANDMPRAAGAARPPRQPMFVARDGPNRMLSRSA